MKKILILHGSHRQRSLTKDLFDALINPLHVNAQIMEYKVSDLQILHCSACLACSKTGVCVLKDDMGKLYDNIEDADAVVITSPIYFNHLPSRLKQVIDRLEPYFFRKLKLGMAPKPKQFLVLMSSGVALKPETRKGVWSTFDLLTKSFNGTLGELVFVEGTDRHSAEMLFRENAEDLTRFQQTLESLLTAE